MFCLKTAALAQKNSEATRVLAAQQEILEKELGEIQKVLLAMQVYITIASFKPETVCFPIRYINHCVSSKILPCLN